MTTQADYVTLLKSPQLLQSCVIHPLKRHKVKIHSSNDVRDINNQQALIIKDLLFILLGHEGQWIRFDKGYDPDERKINVHGPDFKVAKHLDISLKVITKRIIQFGRYYCSINNFLHHYNNEEFGKVVQNLCHALSLFKDRYEQTVIDLEEQFKYNSQFNINQLENKLQKDINTQMSHFYEIINMIHNETMRRQEEYGNDRDRYFGDENQMIDDLYHPEAVDLAVDPIKFNVCKGGLILQLIEDRIKAHKGDQASTEFLSQLFEHVSKDYLLSLNEWLSDGMINDPFNEFMIKQTSFQSFLNSLMQIYWDEIFKFRYDGLIDQFQSKDIQNKILLTGKYLNIFKHCTNIENFEAFNDSLAPIMSISSQDFELKVNYYYKRANKLMMKLIIEGYDLNSVLKYYLNVFFLKDSFNIDRFIEQNLNDLQKSKYKISVSKLTRNFKRILFGNDEMNPVFRTLNGKIDFSVNSLSFYELAKDVLAIEPLNAEDMLKDLNQGGTIEDWVNKSLTNKRQKLNSASSNVNFSNTRENPRQDNSEFDQLTILGICLTMDLPFPLNLVINYNFNLQYQLIFNNQTFLKFLNKLIDNTWKEVSFSDVWKYNFDPKIRKFLIRSRALLHRMKSFIDEIDYHISLEVIERNNLELEKYLKQVTHKLNQEVLESDFKELDSDFNPNSSFVKGASRYHGLFNNKSSEGIESDILDLDQLSNRMATILNNVLRDSFLVHEQVMNELQDLFGLIVLYNQFLGKLKSLLIMMNEELFYHYKEKYPETMEPNQFDEERANSMYRDCDGELTNYFEGFNGLLARFMNSLDSNLDNSSQQFLNLFESLEKCFPEK